MRLQSLLDRKLQEIHGVFGIPKRRLKDTPIRSIVVNPKYPVYIISKGRWESRLTIKALEALGVPYHVVIEPQEFEQYAAPLKLQAFTQTGVADDGIKKIYTLPFSNLGLGSIPARNWVWEHALLIGAKRHWILDDNIRKFYRFNNNLKVPVADGTIFRVMEDFVDRYENIALAGTQYFMFVNRKSKVEPITFNTRIYSCILVNNNIPFRWRGRYNEDTDLSLRVLKAGWCTALFNAFLAEKMPTMTMKGGNTDELYKNNGRLQMAESLCKQHPDVTTIVQKWGRYQHQVDYRKFKFNTLRRKPGIAVPTGINNYGMKLVHLPKKGGV
jgi:hypothetical protein